MTSVPQDTLNAFAKRFSQFAKDDPSNAFAHLQIFVEQGLGQQLTNFYLSSLGDVVFGAQVALNTPQSLVKALEVLDWQFNLFPIDSIERLAVLRKGNTVFDTSVALNTSKSLSLAQKVLDWQYKRYPRNSDEELATLRKSDVVLEALTALNSPKSLSKAWMVLEWQYRHAATDSDEEKAALNKSNAVFDACINLNTSKSVSQAWEILKWQYDRFPKGGKEQAEIAKKLENKTFKDIMERFMTNYGHPSSKKQFPGQSNEPG